MTRITEIDIIFIEIKSVYHVQYNDRCSSYKKKL
jgi:hypothetical protein